ncbi:MAG: YjbQ family protein [Archaeoglobus sp.]|nr:MAG: YjbQ family protein [Archaeoglobus sp.]
MEIFTVSTGRREAKDITPSIKEAVKKLAGGRSGVAFVFTFHTTTALVVNEAESGLMDDLIDAYFSIIPKLNYKHNRIDNNAEAHIMSSAVGNSVALPVEEGELKLGTWQSILLLEFDGPRTRKVGVKFIAE